VAVEQFFNLLNNFGLVSEFKLITLQLKFLANLEYRVVLIRCLFGNEEREIMQ